MYWIVPSISPLLTLERADVEIRSTDLTGARRWARSRPWKSGVRPPLLAQLLTRKLGMQVTPSAFIPQLRPGDEVLVGSVVLPRRITPEDVARPDRVVIRWLVVRVKEPR